MGSTRSGNAASGSTRSATSAIPSAISTTSTSIQSSMDSSREYPTGRTRRFTTTCDRVYCRKTGAVNLHSRPGISENDNRLSRISLRSIRATHLATHLASRLHHDVLSLDADRKRLGLVRPFDQPGARLDRHRVLARAQALRVAPRLTGADVELPRMPRAADDLALARVLVIARLARLHQAD